MNRPRYETAEDRVSEAEVAEAIADKYSFELERKPELSMFDYRMQAAPNGYTLNAEIKCRDFKWGKYQTVILSAHKLAQGLKASRDNTYFTFFVMDSHGAVYSFMPRPENIAHLKNGWGGRQDRDDPQDMEWVVHIPIGLFKHVLDIVV